jgi:hypothetical protein
VEVAREAQEQQRAAERIDAGTKRLAALAADLSRSTALVRNEGH